jgi:hypothetical protein
VSASETTPIRFDAHSHQTTRLKALEQQIHKPLSTVVHVPLLPPTHATNFHDGHTKTRETTAGLDALDDPPRRVLVDCHAEAC